MRASLVAAAAVPPEGHRVAALQRQPGNVHGHVRTGLVNGGNNAHGNVDLAQAQAVGQRLAADNIADRVRQARQVLQRSGKGLDTARRSASGGPGGQQTFRWHGPFHVLGVAARIFVLLAIRAAPMARRPLSFQARFARAIRRAA